MNTALARIRRRPRASASAADAVLPVMTRRAALALMAAPLVARAQNAGGEMIIGALLGLSGSWSTLGQASRVLLETAVGEINAWMSALGGQARVRLLVEDTRLEPDACLAAARALAAAGARLFIGPQSSAEARVLKPFLDASGVVAISHGSTASSLSAAGDNLYRFVPDDRAEAEAVVALALAGGIRTLVPCWRADAGNQGLATSVRRLFEQAGGKVTSGIEYPAEGVVFPQVAVALGEETARVYDGHTAVYLAGFDEVASLLRAADGIPALGSMPWYGSDGVALSAALLADSVAARFAWRVKYANPTLARVETARGKWAPLSAAVRKSIKLEADAFALSSYDACWCAVLARLMAGTDDLEAWRAHFMLTADSFFGATGWGRLNENGDRAFGAYDFWVIRNGGTAPEWARMAQYSTGALEVIA